MMVQVGYCYSLPAVHHNTLIVSPPLDFGHLFNHISHSSQVRAATLRSPFIDVELAYVMNIVGMQEKKHLVMFFLQCMSCRLSENDKHIVPLVDAFSYNPHLSSSRSDSMKITLLSVIHHLPEVPGSGLHGTLSDDEGALMFVTL